MNELIAAEVIRKGHRDGQGVWYIVCGELDEVVVEPEEDDEDDDWFYEEYTMGHMVSNESKTGFFDARVYVI